MIFDQLSIREVQNILFLHAYRRFFVDPFDFKSSSKFRLKQSKGKLPIGGFTATPKALHDFFFVKIVNALYGLYSSKV